MAAVSEAFSYTVATENRHIDHLRPGEVKEVSEHDEHAQSDDFPFAPISTSTLDPPVQQPQPADVPESSEQTPESCLPQPRYPVRSRHPPDRYAPDHYGLWVLTGRSVV